MNTLKLTNQELVEGIIHNDNKIIKQVYNDTFPSIRHLIISNNGNILDAEDVFQETLVVLYRKVRKKDFLLTSSLKTYLYSIARLIWLKELQKRKRAPEQLNEEELIYNTDQSVLELINYNERIRLYRDKFEELSEDCKSVLRMFLNSMPIKEITRIMGYNSDQHTKNRRFRCKQSLINRIQKSNQYKELGNG